VRTVLFNPLYRGEIVYKRTRKRDQWGQKHVTDRPPTEWIHVPAPELRIVSDPLWQAAHARIDAARALYHDVTKGLRGGRRPVDSKYLLPGLARCAVCNGGLFVRSSNHGSGDRRWRVFTYACTTNRNRGAAICPNNVRMPMTQVDVAVLAALREDVFTPDLVDDVLARARGLDEADRPAGLRDRLADELAAVDRQLANLAEAIALGGQLSVLVARVQETDRRRQELARQIRQLDDAVVPRIDWRAAERHARGVLTEWRALLAEQPSDARPLLRELLAGEPIRFTPIDEPTRSGYRFEGTLVIGGLLEGFVGCNGKWRPHRVIAAFSCPRSGARCETWRRLRAAAAGALLRLRLPA
jgi:hypothetical protein